jgi:hypothetical protein
MSLAACLGGDPTEKSFATEIHERVHVRGCSNFVRRLFGGDDIQKKILKAKKIGGSH